MSESISAKRCRINQSHVGDQGELWFAAALPQGWVWQPPRRDFGKDGLIVIRDGSELHNLEFSVQIKTSTRPRVREEFIVLDGISRSSIRYWLASPLPTLVVAVDIVNRAGWYAWHLDLFDSPYEVFEGEAKTMTLRISTKNQLNEVGWRSIRTDLHRHFSALQRALSTDAVAPYLLATVHNVARIVGNLIRLGASAPPEPPFTQREGIAFLVEQMELQDLIFSVRSLLHRVAAGSEANKQIGLWLTSFEKIANDAHPSLRALPPKGHDIPPNFKLAVAPKQLLEARPHLVLAAVDLIRLLTSPKPNTDSTRENVKRANGSQSGAG
ncbi:MAG: DUF4365 domain-containing protein [Deltaproteobacteria bacterium]|nr:DUF4365 domain-containing protein [Deltaproteobacteria bacterium]